MVRAPSSEIMETLQTVAAACPAREGSCVTARRTCPGSQDQGEGRGSRGLWAWRGCQPCTRLWPVLGPVMTPTPCLAGWPPSGLPLPRPFPEACPSPLPGLPGPPPAGVPRLTHGPAQPSPARGAPRVCSGCAPCAASIGAGSRSCPTSPPGSKWVTPHLQSALRFACGRRPPNPAASGGSQLAAASGQGRGVAPGLSAAGPSRPAPAGARRAGGGAAGGARRGRGPRGAGRGRAGAAIGRRGAGRPERRGGVRASREGRAGRGCGARAGVRGPPRVLAERRAGCPRGPGRGARRPRAMRRSSTDESTYRRSPSPPGKEPGFARGGPFFGLHASPGPKAAQARYTSPKGNKYVVFYLDLSFIFLLELKRCSMARGCLQGVKYLMFAFNLLFWLGGCGILGVGIWLAATQGNFATLSSSFPSLSAANLLIVTGAFVMAIGFVGCIGAIKENKCLLLTFFVALLLVFLLEACITILFFAYTDKIDRYAQRDLKKGLHLYGTPGNVGLTNAWSIIQTDFRCCGVSNYTDWFEVYNATRVPDSCCLEFSESYGLHAPGTWWKAPCYETVKMWLQENLLAVGVFGLCTALVQILGLTFAMTMYCQVVRADAYCA
uniref:Tetraspanin-4 n=2 Tax=Bos indicus x Bos taurus TaxID=30522 RepID=A0A4W2DMH1_BOBOX